VDDNAFCPPGYACIHCGCYAKCGSGEFPCAGGYEPSEVNGTCFCLPSPVCNPPCKPGEECRALDGKPTCVDRCAGVNCREGEQCVNGMCRLHTCVEFPSLSHACHRTAGARCDPVKRRCVPDLCCVKTCPRGFCEP